MTDTASWKKTIRYHSFHEEMKKRFGEKVYRISINAGMTCPNRDGKIGTGGCIFCSEGGSGEFAGEKTSSVSEQIAHGIEKIRKKAPACRFFVAYFQAYTNTYAPVEKLRALYEEAVSCKDQGIVAISIATRPDCLGDEVVALLKEINEKMPVWVELGLQTMHEDSARFIRRGYELSCYEQAVAKLKQAGIEVITHLILGLPGETKEQILESVDYVAACHTDGIKLQLLHVLKGTDLADYVQNHAYSYMDMETYADLVVDCLERIPSEIVIHRLTGDGPKWLLVGPMWSADKKRVRNLISKKLRERDTWQGKVAKNSMRRR